MILRAEIFADSLHLHSSSGAPMPICSVVGCDPKKSTRKSRVPRLLGECSTDYSSRWLY